MNSLVTTFSSRRRGNEYKMPQRHKCVNVGVIPTATVLTSTFNYINQLLREQKNLNCVLQKRAMHQIIIEPYSKCIPLKNVNLCKTKFHLEMDILKLSIDWAKAEIFSAKISLLLSLLFFLAVIGFWQLGKTAMAKAFVFPMLVAGVLVVAVAAGFNFFKKPRVSPIGTACHIDKKAFIPAETERTAKSLHCPSLGFQKLAPYI